MGKYNIISILAFLFFSVAAVAQPLRSITYETMLEVADEAAEAKDYSNAIEWYGKAYDESKDKDLKIIIGDLYMLLRDYKKAARNYERALKRDKDGQFEFIRIDYAKALKYQGKYRDALVEFRTVEATTDSDSTRSIAQFEIEGIEATEAFEQNIEAVIGFAGKEVNSGSGENSPSNYIDGSLYYSSFNRNKTIVLDGSEDDYYAKIYSTSVDDDGKFAKPDALDSKINREGYNNAGVSFSADNRLMYFTRTELDVNEILTSKIYTSVRNDSGWDGPNELEGVNGDWLALHPMEGELFGNKVLFFVSDMEGGYGGLDIFYSTISGGTYGQPVNLGKTINTASDEVTPFYKEGTLYYSTDGIPGFGGYDIHYSSWNGEEWSSPVNMGHNYNTAQDDMYLRFSKDGSRGYLVSNRPDKAKKKMKGSETCCDDIYAINLREIVIDLIAKVVDVDTGEPISEATIEMVNTTSSDEDASESKTNVSSNEFNFLLDGDNSYRLVVSREGYYPDTSVTFNTVGILDDYSVKKTIKLKAKPVVPEPNEEETIVVDAYEPIRLNNIYYDFDKSNILESAEDDLLYLKEIMDQYPEMVIELSSHTDSRGINRYNQELSQRRAESAKKWLVSNGVASERIKPVGYGESQILNGCVNGKRCSESEHQLNRRTEFKVLEGPQFITIKKKVTGGLTPGSGDQSGTNSGKQSIELVPVITFEKNMQDLGQIIKGESRDLVFNFTNTGDADLIIEIATTCKCTDIKWPTEAITPGGTGVITATFNTDQQKVGPVEKTIDIVANTDPIVVEAKFRATILSTETKKTNP